MYQCSKYNNHLNVSNKKIKGTLTLNVNTTITSFMS